MDDGVLTLSGSEAEAVRAERARILVDLLGRIDELTEAGVAAIRAEIPAYEAQRDERFLADLANQVRLVYSTSLSAMLEERPVTPDDIAFVRGAATRRAEIGFALEDYLAAFRVGQLVVWDAMVATAAETPEGREAALTLAAPLIRLINFASMHAGQGYVEYRQLAVAEADRERRDLLEVLLAGEVPARGPLHGLATKHGIGTDTSMLVVAAVTVGPRSSAEAIQAASIEVARAGLGEHALVVVRQGEIVAVPVLGAAGDAAKVCARIDAVQERLNAVGTPVAVGVSTVAAGVREIPRAYVEARAARECLSGQPGLVAIPRLTPFEYLVLRADVTARRVVDPTLVAFLEEDVARGGALCTTVQAFAAADLNLRAAAQRLHVHPNTAQYRLRRVEQRTGRNPRRIADLLDLLVAIALHRPPMAAGSLLSKEEPRDGARSGDKVRAVSGSFRELQGTGEDSGEMV
jgi:PucR C-terminal helix-turn-helix domain/GGDEF-like domain